MADTVITTAGGTTVVTVGGSGITKDIGDTYYILKPPSGATGQVLTRLSDGSATWADGGSGGGSGDTVVGW